MLSHEQIWAAIDALAARHSLSADGRPRWPSTESLSKIMDATGASLDDLLAAMRGMMARPAGAGGAVPLLGFAQAGAGGFFDDAGFPVGEGWELVELPGAAREGAYALKVQGESMAPLYRDGDVLIVEPGAVVRRGDRVVVKTVSGEVMAKILQRQSTATVELASLNPAHPERSFPPTDIEWIARIVWASQ
jgi:phage repressor protein C with HTH and peptisase S24 domain